MTTVDLTLHEIMALRWALKHQSSQPTAARYQYGEELRTVGRKLHAAAKVARSE